MGSRHPNIAPYGDVFTTRDGHQIVLAVGNDKQFATLCRSLGREALAADHRFATNADRVKERRALNASLAEAITPLALIDLEKKFYRDGVPFGRIRNMEEVFADPEIKELILEDDEGGKRVRTAVFRFGET
jgi:crotonobetainyl-CoA:carnitine CoA-transferase CaiB-like acyl-CoA transferase